MAWSDRPDVWSRAGLIALALISAAFLLKLDSLPAVVGSDETQFAIHAESLARSGRDLNGTAWPVFIHITDPLVQNNSTSVWYQPLLFYVMTPFIAALGVSVWSMRLPVALIAVASVWLTLAIGRRMFRDQRLAVVTALLLGMTPALLIVSRQALDYIAPLPFILAWWLFVLRYLDDGRERDAVFAGLSLGAGLFSYIAAWVLMPIHLLLTLLAIGSSSAPTRRRAMAGSVAAFAVPAVVLAIALASNSEMLRNTLMRYNLSGAPRPDLYERVRLYFDYFNPSFLFFAGGSNPTQATGRSGVFLLALLPMMVMGVREAWLRKDARRQIVLAAFLAAPLPIAITMPPAAAYSIARTMTMLPFGVLLAAIGLQALQRHARMVAMVLLIAVPLQFMAFARDYAGDYQHRAAPRLDPANMQAVADAVIASDQAKPAPVIYLSSRLDDGGARWRFLTLERRRLDLWQRSRSLNTMETLPAIERGALVVCVAGEPAIATLRSEGYDVVAETGWADAGAAAVILKAPG